MTQDIADLYARERDAFVQDLTRLDEDQWASPSLCAGWSVRDLVAHLLMPFELSGAAFARRLLTARLSFDRLALHWARTDARTPLELRQALAATTAAGFTVPGAGPLAPLAHLTIHAHDVRGPLGIDTSVGPVAASRVLDDITHGKHAVPAGRLDGLHLRTTDASWQYGRGETVTGPAGAMLSALSGRRAAVDRLHGEGAQALRTRLG